jgi:hypothetical protein
VVAPRTPPYANANRQLTFPTRCKYERKKNKRIKKDKLAERALEASSIFISETTPSSLIEETFAGNRAAQAWNTVIAVDFTFEFIVVREFLIYKCN